MFPRRSHNDLGIPLIIYPISHVIKNQNAPVQKLGVVATALKLTYRYMFLSVDTKAFTLGSAKNKVKLTACFSAEPFFTVNPGLHKKFRDELYHAHHTNERLFLQTQGYALITQDFRKGFYFA